MYLPLFYVVLFYHAAHYASCPSFCPFVCPAYAPRHHCIRKYDRRLSTLLHDQLHWLDVPERVEYKLAVMVRRCLENKAPRSLVECCTPVTDYY